MATLDQSPVVIGSMNMEISEGHIVDYIHLGSEVLCQVWTPCGGTDEERNELTREIVKRINCHDDMLAALKVVDADCKLYGEPLKTTRDLFRAVIVKAESQQ